MLYYWSAFGQIARTPEAERYVCARIAECGLASRISQTYTASSEAVFFCIYCGIAACYRAAGFMLFINGAERSKSNEAVRSNKKTPPEKCECIAPVIAWLRNSNNDDLNRALIYFLCYDITNAANRMNCNIRARIGQGFPEPMD